MRAKKPQPVRVDSQPAKESIGRAIISRMMQPDFQLLAAAFRLLACSLLARSQQLDSFRRREIISQTERRAGARP